MRNLETNLTRIARDCVELLEPNALEKGIRLEDGKREPMWV